jgi:uncharacterized protein YyaL (SSP411 family)
MPNRLAHETTPYLQQHADSPVDPYAKIFALTENVPGLPDALDKAVTDRTAAWLCQGTQCLPPLLLLEDLLKQV